MPGMPSLPSGSQGDEQGDRGQSSPGEENAGSDQNSGGDQGQEESGSQGDDSANTSSQSSDGGDQNDGETAEDTAQPGEGRSDEVDFSEEDPSGGSSSSSAESGGSSSASAQSGGSGSARSNSERQAELEGVLNDTMASYDGMILREREYVLNRGNQEGSEEELERGGAGGSLPDGELPYDEAGEEEAGGGSPSGQDDRSSGGGYRPGGPAQNRDGDFNHEGQTPPPEDIPSGNDDDVVARQIREAAMRETDPVLREKLWDEYRKYKNQTN